MRNPPGLYGQLFPAPLDTLREPGPAVAPQNFSFCLSGRADGGFRTGITSKGPKAHGGGARLPSLRKRNISPRCPRPGFYLRNDARFLLRPMLNPATKRLAGRVGRFGKKLILFLNNFL